VPGFVCARRHSKEAFPNTHTPPHLNPDSSARPASARGHVRTIKQPFVLLRETVGVCDAEAKPVREPEQDITSHERGFFAFVQ
jgi:hypothetical protein